MQTYEIAVVNRSVRGNSEDMTLVRTSVGIDQVHVLFDNAEWLDFPVTISFGQGDDLITQSLIVSGIEGSTEWVAEATVLVPHEVIDMTGSIRVTLQGTDADGRHIITAYGAPLSVEEAGDVMQGDVPEDAPTPDQWHQAYAEAQVAINEMITVRDNAQAVVDALQSRLDELVAQASAALDGKIEEYRVPATTERLGMVKVGDGLAVTEDGTLSSLRTNGITREQVNVIANTQLLATKAFDTTFDEDTGALVAARLKADAMPEDYDAGISADDIGAGLTLDEDDKLTIHGGGNVTTNEDGALVANNVVQATGQYMKVTEGDASGAKMYYVTHKTLAERGQGTYVPAANVPVGQAGDVTPWFGASFKALHVAADDAGHVSRLQEHAVTLPGVGTGLTSEYVDGKQRLAVDPSSLYGTGLESEYVGGKMKLALGYDYRKKIDEAPETNSLGSAEDAATAIESYVESYTGSEFRSDFPGGVLVMAPGRIAFLEAEGVGDDATVAVTDIYNANA